VKNSFTRCSDFILWITYTPTRLASGIITSTPYHPLVTSVLRLNFSQRIHTQYFVQLDLMAGKCREQLPEHVYSPLVLDEFVFSSSNPGIIRQKGDRDFTRLKFCTLDCSEPEPKPSLFISLPSHILVP
jgi:hypothetical protein